MVQSDRQSLCLNAAELERIVAAYDGRRTTCEAGGRGPILMVGYNRRFAPLVRQIAAAVQSRVQPLAMIYTCNAGRVPAEHWTLDAAVGGGRIIGEACHFVDLLHYLSGEAAITQLTAVPLGPAEDRSTDTVAITLRLADGSLGQINYFANGPKQFPKERLEVFWEGRALRLDNFRRLEGFGRGTPRRRSWNQDKGHELEFGAFVQALRNGEPSPIPFESLVHTTQATLAVLEAMRGQPVVNLP